MYRLSVLITVFIFFATLPLSALKMEYSFSGSKNWILTYKIDSTITINGNDSSFSVSGKEMLKIVQLSDSTFRLEARCEYLKFEAKENYDNELELDKLGVLTKNKRYVAIYDVHGRLKRIIESPSPNFRYYFISKLPLGEINPGDSFQANREIDVQNVGRSRVAITTTFKSLNRKVGKFTIRGKLRRRKNSFNSHVSGKFLFDFRDGLITRAKTKNIVSVRINDRMISQTVYFNYDIRKYVIPKFNDDFWE